MGAPTYRILDLDNCISDDSARAHHLRGKRPDYAAYHAQLLEDPLGNQDLLRCEHRLLIITARPVRYAASTLAWLRLHAIPYAHLIMRNNDEHASSVDVKRRRIDWLEDYYEVPRDCIADAYDDRPAIVDMYRSLGLNAHVRAIHDCY